MSDTKHKSAAMPGPTRNQFAAVGAHTNLERLIF